MRRFWEFTSANYAYISRRLATERAARGDSVCELDVVYFGLSDLLDDAVGDFVSTD